MPRRPHPLWLLAATPLLFAAGAAVGPARFPGFSIEPLPAAPPGVQQLVLTMSLPPDDTGFAANVNVMRQPWADTLDAYDDLTDAQLDQMGWRVTEREALEGELRYRYEGAFQGRPLRWSARAVPGDGVVFLVTATATPEQWERSGAQLDRSVESFEPEG